MPEATHAPTLYALGDTVSEWVTVALDQVQSDCLIVANVRLKVRYALVRNELPNAAPTTFRSRHDACNVRYARDARRWPITPLCRLWSRDAWTRTATAPI
jgi:hypothetical protein